MAKKIIFKDELCLQCA